MVARARKQDETFEDYRNSLREEEKALKAALRGSYAHVSCVVRQKKDEDTGVVSSFITKGVTYEKDRHPSR